MFETTTQACTLASYNTNGVHHNHPPDFLAHFCSWFPKIIMLGNLGASIPPARFCRFQRNQLPVVSFCWTAACDLVVRSMQVPWVLISGDGYCGRAMTAVASSNCTIHTPRPISNWPPPPPPPPQQQQPQQQQQQQQPQQQQQQEHLAPSSFMAFLMFF